MVSNNYKNAHYTSQDNMDNSSSLVVYIVWVLRDDAQSDRKTQGVYELTHH
jgi:hypothetical protein